MHLLSFRIILGLLLAATSLLALGAHQVGGQLEMQAIGDIPGHYRVIVTNYFEAGTQAEIQQGGGLGLYRKKDNTLLFTFYAKRTGADVPIVFSNAFCAKLRNLNFITATYQAEIQLNPDEYTDSEGYYISFQGRNRNLNVTNIRKSYDTGFTYYLEFPPLKQNGRLVPFSSPHFPPMNGEYICLNQPFKFAFGAVDPNGDQLTYTLVTPLNQRYSTQPISPGPYPGINWQSGFGPNNAIHGSPPLSINAKTGELSVTASETGLFVFGVKVEKYRAGKKLGEVRRDFQLLVIDCSQKAIPDPKIQIAGASTGSQEKTICRGDSVVIRAPVNPSWHYQWRRNGSNISRASRPSLTVYEAGDYSLIVSSKDECLKPGTSQRVTVKIDTLTSTIRASGSLCAVNGSIQLKASADSEVRYQWYKNGQPITNQTSDSLRVDQEGQYWAQLTHISLGCTFKSDTLSINRLPPQPATIQAVEGSNRLCPNDSLLLESSPGNGYQWQRDGQPIPGATSKRYQARAAGNYVVSVLASDGCPHPSGAFTIEAIPAITVLFDSIPPVCDTAGVVITLTGTPAGGEFAGNGVISNKFDSERAGIGTHELTYTVKPAPECAGTTARRVASVGNSPTIELPNHLVTNKGGTVQLAPLVMNTAVSFQWTPATYLDNAQIAQPVAVSVTDDITYTFRAATAEGCYQEDTVRIDVLDRVWVPDAFTPNGDGLNDTLALPGIAGFPDAILTIYNNWGEIVYRSEKGYPVPFDGTFRGNKLPVGVYPYKLQQDSASPPILGQILILRD